MSTLYIQFIHVKVKGEKGRKPSYWVPDEGIKKDLINTVKGEIKKALGEKISFDAKKSKQDRGLIIAFHNEDDFLPDHNLSNPNVIRKLINPESQLRKVSENDSDELFDYHPDPMILVSDLLLFSEKHNKATLTNEDPRALFFDSCIWHRHVCRAPRESFEKRLINRVKTIISYADKGLYSTVVAEEYLEFHCRRMLASYVKSSHRIKAGHQKRVTPFRFHSETYMKHMADQLLKGELGPYTWGCLLIDDYANRSLRPIREETPPLKTPNKIKLILNLINQRPKFKKKKQPVIEFLNKKSTTSIPEDGFISQGIREIAADTRPDIIILDYFFGIEEKNPYEQYGYELIRRLRTPEKMNQQGLTAENLAFGKFWIFLASAFEHAFRSHLRTLGESTDGYNINILDGADPVNSPELFRYMFYKGLLVQKETVGIQLAPVIRNILTRLGKTRKEQIENISELRILVEEHYHHITENIVLIRKLNGARGKSRLADSYLSIVDKAMVLENVCMHVQRLAFLIAYKTRDSWPEMWMEFQMLKGIIENIAIENKLGGIRLQKQFSEGKELLQLTEKYIEILKVNYSQKS